MTARNWFWRALIAFALVAIVVAGAYLGRQPRDPAAAESRLQATPAAAASAAKQSGDPAAPPISTAPPATPAPVKPVVLRGSDTTPKLDLPATVERLKRAMIADAPPLVSAVAALLSTSPEERSKAVEALGYSEDARFMPPIIHLLQNDPETEVRAEAAAALEPFRGREVATALADALTDPSEEVRDNALLSLQVQRDSDTQHELLRMLTDGQLDAETARDVRLFLDQHYVRKDPFKDPVEP